MAVHFFRNPDIEAVRTHLPLFESPAQSSTATEYLDQMERSIEVFIALQPSSRAQETFSVRWQKPRSP